MKKLQRTAKAPLTVDDLRNFLDANKDLPGNVLIAVMVVYNTDIEGDLIPNPKGVSDAWGGVREETVTLLERLDPPEATESVIVFHVCDWERYTKDY